MAARMNCPTCSSKISCGCQLKTASNGTRVCNYCITAYEEKLKNEIQWKHVTTVTTVDQNPST